MADPQWLVHREGQPPLGPVSADLLRRGVEAGRVPQDALVCLLGGEEWVPVAEALRSPQQTPPAAPSPPRAPAKEKPLFLDRCPQCDRKALRPRSKTKDWRCSACGYVVDAQEAAEMVHVEERAELINREIELRWEAERALDEVVGAHLERLALKTAPPAKDASSGLGCLLAPLLGAGGIAAAHQVIPAADWPMKWLGGGVLGLLVGGTISVVFLVATPSTAPTNHPPGRLIEIPASARSRLTAMYPELLNMAIKFASPSRPQDDDEDDGDPDDDEELGDVTEPDYWDFERLSGRVKSLLEGTAVLAQAGVMVSVDDPTSGRVPLAQVAKILPDGAWPLVALVLLADAYAEPEHLEQVRALLRDQGSRHELTGTSPREKA